jgi:RNA polymerase sigma-70 factor, ECF subfamily
VSTRSPAEPPDEGLVRRVIAGQRAAFDLLIERYQRRAVAVSYRLVGNIHDALEVCQDAFVRAYRNLDTLEDPARFGPWLLRIVSNLSLNFRRDRAVGRPRVSLEDCVSDDAAPRHETLAAPSHSSDQPGAELHAGELAQLVQQAMGELPDAQRLALVLFSVEQMPQREVAEILGCSVEAVKWHVFQARKKLRERLGDHLVDS